MAVVGLSFLVLWWMPMVPSSRDLIADGVRVEAQGRRDGRQVFLAAAVATQDQVQVVWRHADGPFQLILRHPLVDQRFLDGTSQRRQWPRPRSLPRHCNPPPNNLLAGFSVALQLIFLSPVGPE